ncbi:MAG: sigma-54 dependent transcriptional regulator [Pseudomonadota bacterium]
MCHERSTLQHQVLLTRRLARVCAPVLIQGETGTGKELFARLIHECSPRSQGPFVAVNCAAIPENLLESELFGHLKGAFTGAIAARRGRCEMAQGGTLFLDEIGDMPLALQPKLLRMLQEMEFTPVGGCSPVTADFRVVAATHRDLAREVEAERFRSDLFYRLNVLNLQLPPLRERPEDVQHLGQHFIDRFATSLDIPPPVLSEEARTMLLRHSWPGNVRELENAIYRCVVLCDGPTIEVSLLGSSVRTERTPQAASSSELEIPNNGLQLNDVLQALESKLIRQALKRTGGNKAQAAQLLGLNRTTLVEKLRKIELLACAA